MKKELKSEIVEIVIKFFKDEVSYEELMMNAPEGLTGDKSLDEIFDLIEHEPKKGGFLGVNSETHLNHRKKIQELVSKVSDIPMTELGFILSKN